MPRDVIPPELTRHVPEVLFTLDWRQLNKNLRSTKRGAAPGPSGVTVEHLHPLLDHSGDLRLFVAAAEMLARGQVPESIQTAIKLDRMTALSKVDGGVRGIVAGNVMRRLVARTMSQQLMEVVQSTTSPFQNAMVTRARCECISRVLQVLTELNPNATILSVNGMSAYDTISRRAMLQGLSNVEGGLRNICGRTSAESPTQSTRGEGARWRHDAIALLPWPAQSPAVGARRTSGGRGSAGFLGRHVPCHISQENDDSVRHIAGRFVDGGRHPPQSRQNKNLEFSRGETFRVQCFCRWLLKHLTQLLLSGDGQGCPHSNRG